MRSIRFTRLLYLALGCLLTISLVPVWNFVSFRIRTLPTQWHRRGNIQKFENKAFDVAFTVEKIVGGLTVPWDIAWDPDGRMFSVDRGGDVFLIDPAAHTKQLYFHVDDVLSNADTLHSGLFDIEFHPDFATNRWVYLYYSFQDKALLPIPDAAFSRETGDWGLRNKIVRYRDEDGSLVFDRVIFVSDHGERTRSCGGRMHFGPDGKLYVASPFATTWHAPQDLGNNLGKMLRINDDGSIPADNPFVDTPGAKPEIWTLGHKDIYGFDWHAGTGKLLSIEHGPTQEHVDAWGFDEINSIVRGGNFGFPVSWGEWVAPETKAPVHFWPFPHPPGDLMVYRGDAFPPWQDSVFVSNMANQSLHRLQFDGHRITQDEILLQWIPDPWAPLDRGLGDRPRTRMGRIRAITQGPDGCIYVTTDLRRKRGGLDSIYRLRPASE